MPAAPDLTLALWATNLGMRIADLGEWAARVEARAGEAASGGADMLVMPEYAADSWLAFRPRGLKPSEETAFLAAHAPRAVDLVAGIAARHAIAIAAGTMPWLQPDGTITNRAWILLPDGARHWQDKLVLTPGERDPAGGMLATGDALRLFTWKGLRCAVAICLDAEVPALSVLLAQANIDLLLVPSMTELPSGHARVFSCAKARAVEAMCVVAAVGTVGAAIGSPPDAQSHSACAVFVPCESALGSTGVHTLTGICDGADGTDPFVIARDIPVGMLAELRAGRAEVWPGPWDAGHIKIIEAQ